MRSLIRGRFRMAPFVSEGRRSCALGLALGLSAVSCGDEPFHALSSDSASAEGLDYQPRIGVGVNASETKTFRRCVTIPTSETRHAFAKRLYTELAIHDRNELNDALDVSASVSAKGLWGSASGSASYFKNVHISGDAFYWLVNAHYRLLDEGIDTGDPSFGLTDEAKRILNGPGGLAAFYRACGDAFYSGATKGAQYALLYEFKTREEKTIERLKAMAEGSAFGVEAKASFSKLSEMAMKSSVLKVHSATEGGGDRLQSYATSPENLEREMAILRDDLYNHGRGVEVQWFVSDYNMFPEIAEAVANAAAAHEPTPTHIDKLVKDAALAKLYQRYNKNVDQQQHITLKLESATGVDPLYAFSEAKRQRLKEALALIERSNTDIALSAKGCIAKDDVDACLVEDVGQALDLLGSEMDDLLRPDEDYTTLQDWSLKFTQVQGSKKYLRIEGKQEGDQGQPTVFDTGYSLTDTFDGVMARNDEGQQLARIIGTVSRVRDPYSGLFRPNVCVYNYADTCSLRIAKLPAARAGARKGVKLQLVLYDAYGFVEKKLDFPVVN